MNLDPNSGLRLHVNSFLSERREMRYIQSTMPRSSYSQFGEDAVLQSILPNKRGFYIDIGSGHPVLGSNTYSLYKLGWSGILVDPIPRNIALSRKLRGRDNIIQAAVGASKSESLIFYEFDPYHYSTTSLERAEEVKLAGHRVISTYSVDIIALSEIFDNYLPSGPSVMSLDVEGNELDVFSSNNWEIFAPDFIMVEDFGKPWIQRTAVQEFLGNKQYELHSVCGFSSIYVRG